MILFKDEMLPLSLLCAGEKQGSGAEATGAVKRGFGGCNDSAIRFQGKCGSGYRIARFDEALSFPATGNIVSIVERIFLVGLVSGFFERSGTGSGFCLCSVRQASDFPGNPEDVSR